jgi:uncharacterized protein (TIGR02588 family)
MAGEETKNKEAGAEQDERIEWWLGIASAVVTLALIGYLLVEGLTGSGSGPILSVMLGPVRQAADDYVLQVNVRNEGDQTASEVVVEGRLGAGNGAEVSAVTLDYVPPGPGTPAALVFSRDPHAEAVVLTIKGYRYP